MRRTKGKTSRMVMAGILAAAMLVGTGCGAGEVTDTAVTTEEAAQVAEDEQAGEAAQAEGDEAAGEDQQAESAEASETEAPDFMKTAVLYEVNLRQYTPSSSINEFAEHLEELQEMGINTLWFMPIHPISVTNRSGKLGSYYSVDNYREVNPEFGTKEDFKALVDQAHDMGFHVILDWVANHTGWDNPWITEHPDWYTQKDGKIISPEGMGWPDVADLNYDNAEMRQEMIDCMKYWVTEFDIDGFRCDYAPGVPADFWEDARAQLDQIKDIYMLEEDLGGQASDHLKYAFDSNYAAKVYETLIAVGKGGKTPDKIKIYIPTSKNNTFPMYYLDNHDVNSYDRTIAQAFEPDVLPSMFTLIFTLPGVPMLYSGDEIAYDHAIAFMEKDTIDWDLTGQNYRPLIRSLADLKGAHPALYSDNTGEGIEFLDLGNKNLFAFYRIADGDRLLCLYNLSKKEQADIDLSGILTGSEEVLFSGTGADYAEGGTLPEGTHTFAPWEFYVIAAN